VIRLIDFTTLKNKTIPNCFTILPNKVDLIIHLLNDEKERFSLNDLVFGEGLYPNGSMYLGCEC